MKGIVFTEFVDYVEDVFGFETTEDMIEQSDLPSGGIYTSVGTYDHTEIITLVTNLSRLTGQPVAELVQSFGVALGNRFVEKFGQFFALETRLFDFLDSVEEYIHVEVYKLYPDAQLPSIVMMERDEFDARMRYRSPRGMDDLAVGLIKASATHYGDTVSIVRESGEDRDGSYVDLNIKRSPIPSNSDHPDDR